MSEQKDMFQQTGTPAPQKVSDNALAIKEMGKELEMKVIDQISQLQESGLQLPDGYNPSNAIKYAWLKLQGTEDKNGGKALDVCTKTSIANALLAMVLKGETMLHNHGYFIAYGDKLTYHEDYRGKLMRALRDTQIADVDAQVIYEGDKFTYTVDKRGRYQFVSHESKMENIDINKIKGGYAIVTYKDGTEKMTIMTMAQIQQAWKQGATNGASPAHKNFPDQMAIKTLIQRAIKIDLGKVTDTISFDDEEDEEIADTAQATRDNDQKGIDFTPATDYEDVTEVVVETPKPESKTRTKKESPI